MGLEGKFKKITCQRIGGKIWSFELSNSNWFRKKTFSIGIYDTYRQNPWFWRGITLTSGKTVAFNYDTVDWFFCQGDIVAILDGKDNIIKSWRLQIPEYSQGSCPECHGTHKCRRCNGQGFIWPKGRVEEYSKCPDCEGTGVCQTCYIPRRSNHYEGMPTGLQPF